LANDEALPVSAASVVEADAAVDEGQTALRQENGLLDGKLSEFGAQRSGIALAQLEKIQIRQGGDFARA
jgi:hypothetical protein